MSKFAFKATAILFRLISKLPITRRLAAKLFSRVCENTVPIQKLRSTLAGLQITLDLSKGIDRTIYLQGAYDLRGIRAIQQVMEKLNPRTAWDVGANRGNHAAFMRPLCRRLFCFEPNPAEFLRLSDLFQNDRHVTVLDIGLSDVCATRPFLIHNQESGNSTFEVIPDQANANLRVETGDEIVHAYDIADLDFIKIDVEGHEACLLKGLSSTIRQQRPVIIFEILELQSTIDFGFESLFPNYLIYGNRTGLISKITMSAYTFCEFNYGNTYMCALAVPIEKKAYLRNLLPH